MEVPQRCRMAAGIETWPPFEIFMRAFMNMKSTMNQGAAGSVPAFHPDAPTVPRNVSRRESAIHPSGGFEPFSDIAGEVR